MPTAAQPSVPPSRRPPRQTLPRAPADDLHTSAAPRPRAERSGLASPASDELPTDFRPGNPRPGTREVLRPSPINLGHLFIRKGQFSLTFRVGQARPQRHREFNAVVSWVRRRLAPRLQPGDIVLLDNLAAHKAAAVRRFVGARGAQWRFLPPYSPDVSPIEPAWSLVKRGIRAHAPRTAPALRRVAHRARHVVRPAHCRQ